MPSVVRVYAESGDSRWFDSTSYYKIPVITDFYRGLRLVCTDAPPEFDPVGFMIMKTSKERLS